MSEEMIELGVALEPESGKPIIVDQHGRRLAGCLLFNTEVAHNQVAFVTLTAHLFAKGKKFIGRGN
jgi:hypothetical protein